MMTTFSSVAFKMNCSLHQKPSTILHNQQYLGMSFSSSLKAIMSQKGLLVNIGEDVSIAIKKTSTKVLDSFVDLVFQFEDQPLLSSQTNFAPVDELGSPIVISTIDGNIPHNFPEGVYIRNGANPLHGGLKSAKSIFGKSNHIWIEGEGMLHALYFCRDGLSDWTLRYNNKYVETETYKQEKLRKKPSFIPIMEGDFLAVVLATLLNKLRFGKIDKHVSNTNVFEHSGKVYSIAECHLPNEINISTLKTVGNWNLSTTWNRPFTSHPKKDPATGELVIIGLDPIMSSVELGVVSADGNKLVHMVDLNLGRGTFCHDFGITRRYNVFLDFPVTIDLKRFIQGGPLIKYNKDEYARIGVMPRYGNAKSIKWFDVEANCTFHLINCFEDKDGEVVVWGCRALDSVLPFDKSSRDGSVVHTLPFEWRLNMRTGKVMNERNLLDYTEFSMDVPFINEKFSGIKNRFGYTQVYKTLSNTRPDNIPKFEGLAKLDFQPLDIIFSSQKIKSEDVIKVEYHMFEDNTFCTGATFIHKHGSLEEDDGWIMTFVHNEDTNTSQVFIIDTEKFSSEPVVKITLPSRVPYGFHGAFIPSSSKHTIK